jgi:murein L,D-transpeptidase YcbB/YkuD
VPLDEPIPLTIGYFTVWVDDDGAVRFLPDVYRHDAAQMRAF